MNTASTRAADLGSNPGTHLGTATDHRERQRRSDLNHVSARHDAIHLRLEQWGRWATARGGQSVHPMFRQYQSKARQWELPELRVPCSPLQALEVERAVQILPEAQRTAIRWAYVWPWVPVPQVLRTLAVNRPGLCLLLDSGRDMVKNRLAQARVGEWD